MNAEREWSNPELTQLGNMLVRGLSIEEIAQPLDRDRGDIQDKVVEIARGGEEAPLKGLTRSSPQY